MCLSDVCTTLQILLNFHKTDKNKKGARLTKSKLYGILMSKILFHDAKMIPKLSFFEHVPFLRQYVFFSFSWTKNIYNFQVRSPHSAFKNESFFITELSFAFFLMLITMTCNTWLFIAVVMVEGWAFILCHRWLSHMLVARRLMTALTYRLIYWPQDISNCNTCSNIINCKEGTKWSTRAIEWWLWMYDLKLCRIPSICRFLSQFSIFLQT